MRTRGTVHTLAGLALAFAAATGCSDGRSPIAPTAAMYGPAFSSASGPGTFLQGDPDLGPEIAAIRAATVQFHDVNAAIAAGYADPAGRPCDSNPNGTGAMGVHSPNPGLMADQAIDPLRPEVLLYLPKPEGGYRLTGVEYVQFIIVTDPQPGGFSGPWVPQTPWPDDYLVSPVPELFGHQFLGPVAGHFPGMPWHREIHAWVWAHNPTGMFEPWNPAISCP